MKNSSIQWTDDTVNPVAGCDGCELLTTIPELRQIIVAFVLASAPGTTSAQILAELAPRIAGLEATQIHKRRKDIARDLCGVFHINDAKLQARLALEIGTPLRCYAAQLTNRYGGSSSGYPAVFEHPKLFPGRMAKAAKERDLTGTMRVDKPQLNQLPRLIFVSDMGDALSNGVPFPFLKTEIIDVVKSPSGRRHVWLWLTKRPKRMVEFWRWLLAQGIPWPTNLVPMTSVTSDLMAHRATELAEMDVPVKGLSVEPLWTPVRLPLGGIDWVIVGGESGTHANPFHVEWATDIREQCRVSGSAFFLKQLGQNPYINGQPLKLRDKHGGDMKEWPADLRCRQFPAAFYRNVGQMAA